jgi:hypothetical protein
MGQLETGHDILRTLNFAIATGKGPKYYEDCAFVQGTICLEVSFLFLPILV